MEWDFDTPMDNAKIADIFQEIADILEIQGESVFRIRSYQRAAQVIRNFPYDIREIFEKNPKEIREIPGIGEHLALKIAEILKTGQCEAHQKLVKEIGRGLLEILRLRGVGPKKVKLFFQELAIDTVKKLESAAKKGLIRELPGMGEKSELEILKAIHDLRQFSERTPLYLALLHAEEYVKYLKKCPVVDAVEIAGSLRRRLATIGDIDILVTTRRSRAPEHQKAISFFCAYPDVTQILAEGETKASVLLSSGVQVDLRVVNKGSFGAALQYFIGSKTHNVAVRNMAKQRGLKLSEYGVFRGNRKIAGATEKDVYRAIGLPYIIPEMREDRGEIEAALSGTLPRTIELSDIRGDLHAHTKETDGSNSIAEMVSMAMKLGYEYIAITDHSAAVSVAHGMDEARLLAQIREIDRLQKELPAGFRIFKGMEVDIRKDGTLDMPDCALSKLDLVIASVHSAMTLPEEEQTKRVIRALANPYVTILGHPTGRMLGSRNPMNLDMEKVMRAAKEYGVVLELNASPLRLDLHDAHCRMAKDMGVPISINTDAHHFSQFTFMRFGVFTARKGWIEKKEVINAMPLGKLMAFLRKK